MKFLPRVSCWTRSARLATLGAMAALAVLVAFEATAQTVDIATAPLYAGATPSPNVVISASFEFPTAGQAYLGIPYSSSSTYTGYFDPTKCYLYNGSIILKPDSFGHLNEGDPNGYFYVAPSATGIAVNHVCGPLLFSGNLMNWATMSALDEFRFALTGGNRDKETGTGAQSPNNGTILQRAYLTGCKASISYTSNCTNDLANTAVPGVYDFYNAGGLYPQLGPINYGFGQLIPVNAYVNNCKTYMYLSFNNNGNAGNCTYPIAEGGVYNIRVSVCDSTEGPTRTDLCLQYGGTNGNYKPVGTVQRSADKMRFAIFGYLVDRSVTGYTVPSMYGSNCLDDLFSGDPWNRCRVGGVLRSPMKYVGRTTYDANGVPSTNTKTEINADGTMVDDPEGNASAFGGKYSGFLNYLNRFGTAVQANPPAGSLAGAGEYKRYDTMGEMYYEAIRYYQNLPPTPETYQGTYPNQVAGYFPVLSSTNWPADPIVAQCASNYIISISDTDTWDDTYLPGYAGSPTPNNPRNNGKVYRPSSRPVSGGLDAYAWTKKIGVLEATTPSIIMAGTDVRPYMANASNPYTSVPATQIQDVFTGSFDTATYFSAGAAYWANTNDIRPDLPPLGGGKIHSIKTISVDTGGQSRPVWDRQLYLMGKYGGFKNTIDRTVDGTQANPFYATDPGNTSAPPSAAIPNGKTLRAPASR